ncbi:PP2C family protein-serine/threonine phosphatase [Fusibacter ferrireducens]|uniref:Serine/threonine-protein phosphatase n=1 Tax=Fusibacter ferrireducens TaxID=2785058 RepID=A0ABR9ZZ02_9FIRM|nr:PP2C family protein-serine/threonine phosphatase [Fusibacter ferrireducens]MBF4695677.1 serine/threonine-protein phosphatase [Fusibacter ferrireducens]
MYQTQTHLKEYQRILTICTILVGMLLLERFFLTVFLQTYAKIMLGSILLLNVVIGSILINTTFYASRININRQFMAIAFGTYLYVINMGIAMIILLTSNITLVREVTFFLTIGKSLFLTGLIVPFLLSKVSFFRENSYMKMTGISTLIITGEIFLYVITFRLLIVPNEILYFMNILYLLGLMIFLLELILNDLLKAKTNTYMMIFSFILLFIAQFYLTVMSLSTFTLIQSSMINAVALIVLLMEIHAFNIEIPEAKNRQLQKQFNIYSKYLKRIIDKKTLLVREVNQKIIDELEYAKIIQQSLLPSSKITHRDVSFTSAYHPCERLSGDFYDIYSIDDDNVALYLLDVSGHGISAALMTMLSNNYLKSNERVIKRFRGMHPDKNLKYFYEQFNRMNFPDEMHMVIFYATLNLNTKVLTYCSGGMNCNPIRFKSNGKVEFLDQSKGFPICKLEGFFTPEYTSETIQLQHGDRILFYTDGLTDKEKNNIFDTDEIIELFVTSRNLTSREINDIIVDKINAQRGVLNDDITYILVDI